MKIKIFVPFFILLLALSCNKNEEQLICCDFEISYITEYDLLSNWSLIGIIDSRPFSEECTYGIGGHIRFNSDGTFGGSLSCNAMGGEYKLYGDNKIEILNIFQTLRACIENESEYWEEKFPKELRESESYRIDGNKMIIYTSSGKQMVFKAFE
jgi:hypothetical protein